MVTEFTMASTLQNEVDNKKWMREVTKFGSTSGNVGQYVGNWGERWQRHDEGGKCMTKGEKI